MGVPEPGDDRLVIKRAGARDGQVFFQPVRLDRPIPSWNLDLSTGSFVLEGYEATAAEGGPPSLVHPWEGPGDLFYGRLFPPSPDRVSRLDGVPPGRGKLVRPSMDSFPDPGAWDVAAKFTIAPGRETRITAP